MILIQLQRGHRLICHNKSFSSHLHIQQVYLLLSWCCRLQLPSWSQQCGLLYLRFRWLLTSKPDCRFWHVIKQWYFSPRGMHSVHRCRLLLHLSVHSYSTICLCACLSICLLSLQNQLNQLRCCLVGDRNHVLYGSTYWHHLANMMEQSMLGGSVDCCGHYCSNLLMHMQTPTWVSCLPAWFS